MLVLDKVHLDIFTHDSKKYSTLCVDVYVYSIFCACVRTNTCIFLLHRILM